MHPETSPTPASMEVLRQQEAALAEVLCLQSERMIEQKIWGRLAEQADTDSLYNRIIEDKVIPHVRRFLVTVSAEDAREYVAFGYCERGSLPRPNAPTYALFYYDYRLGLGRHGDVRLLNPKLPAHEIRVLTQMVDDLLELKYQGIIPTDCDLV